MEAWLGAWGSETTNERRRKSMPIRLVDLNREEARSIAEGGLLVLPLGSTEQHGPHLPIGTDGICAEAVALRAAGEIAEHTPIAVAPTLWFGSSPHHIQHGATISLRSETLLRVLMDIGESLSASGFRKLFILNGHGGNHELMFVAARDLALATEMRVGACSWWAVALDKLDAENADRVDRIPGHAGGFETSVVLAISPDLIRSEPPDREVESGSVPSWGLRSAIRIEDPATWGTIDGFSDNPAGGSVELGELYLKVGTQAVIDAIQTFLEY